MISPLDIPGVILSQRVHDLMRSGTSVVDVSKDMQLVDGESLYHITDSTDEIISPASRDDSVYDYCHICCLVDIISPLMEQFLDDIGEVFRE